MFSPDIKKWLFCAALSFVFLPVSAQLDSLSFYDECRLNPEDKNKLEFCFDNLNFVLDNEYKGVLVKGYTLPGLWLLPRFTYQPLKNLKVEAGAYLLRYWGADRYPNLNYSDIAVWKGGQYQKGFHALPFFRVHYRASKTFDIILGHYYGKNNHRLIEPLYNAEMGLSADPEAGMQLLWKTRVFDMDAWINWESFIFQQDDHQEAFTFGISSRLKAAGFSDKVNVYFPIQTLFQHRGGEINTEAHFRSIQTWLNAAGGVGINVNGSRKIFRRFNAEVDGAFFSQQAGTLLPFDRGFGFQARAFVDLYRFRILGGYWQSHDFVTIFGNPHFGCVSIQDENITYKNPKMLFFKIQYAQRIAKGFAWGIHADLYNQLPVMVNDPEVGWYRQKNAPSVAVGLYLRTNFSLLLKKFN